MMTVIEDLPEGHPLRNTPFNLIKAEGRLRNMKSWKKIATWKIGPCSYNQLTGSLKVNYTFRTPVHHNP